MSSAFGAETVLEVRHWTDAYFSFTTTRDSGFRFENGQFVMIGLETEADRCCAPIPLPVPTGKNNWSSSASRCRTAR